MMLLCFLCFCLSGFKAQVNIVVDPSFELYDTCPGPFNYGCRTWHSLDSINNTNQTVSDCTPVYFNSCATYGFNSLPSNNATGPDYQNSRTGNGMYGVAFFLLSSVNPIYNRDYLRGRIKNIVAGKQYCGKFYVNLCGNEYYAVDRFCAYLDNGVLDANNTCLPIIVTPSFENPAGNYIIDTLGWQRVQGVFTANGSETYITIGNFYSESNTGKMVFNAASSRFGEAYYYVDDVSIVPIEIKALAGEDATLCVNDSLVLGRPQEIGIDCQWYVPGNATPFSTNSQFTFHATQTGTYTFVQRMDNCAISFDTVNITVIQDCNPTFFIPNVFTPNEDSVNDTWLATLPKGSFLNGLEIYNRWGNLMYQPDALLLDTHTISTILWDGRTTSGEKASEGVYYYVLEYTDKQGNKQKKNGYISLFR
jgi:gliding motility-associated-like protein